MDELKLPNAEIIGAVIAAKTAQLANSG